VPLIWFVISVIIGIAMQAVQLQEFNFVDFFYTNYLRFLTDLFTSFETVLGGYILPALLFTNFFYIIYTISGLIIIFRLLKDLRNKNAQKILLGLLIIFGGIFLFNHILNSGLNTVSEKSKYPGCPDYIIPDEINFEIREGIGLKGGLYMRRIGNPKWKDGSTVRVYTRDNFDTKESIKDTKGYGLSPICVKGATSGQNLNYYYCDKLAYFKEIQEISDEGVIGEKVKTEYRVDLVLNKTKDVYSTPTYFSPYPTVEYSVFNIIEAKCKKR